MEGGEPSTIQLVTLSSNTHNEIIVPVQTKRLSVKEKNIAIRGRLAWDTILIADKHRSYASFAEQNNIHLYQLLGKEHVHKNDPSVNVQRMNNLHSRFKRFLKPFFGVSRKYYVIIFILFAIISMISFLFRQRYSIQIKYKANRTTIQYRSCYSIRLVSVKGISTGHFAI